MIAALLLAAASIAGWYALLQDDRELLATLVLLGGLGLAIAVGFVAQWLALARSVWQWVGIVRSKPGTVTVRSVEPPRGFLIRRDANVTMAIEDEGRVETVEQGISIPFLPALVWRLAGRVPTPIGRLTDKRDLDAKVWDRS
ncbi:MAG: hypothetical protein ACRDKH_01605 [Solirubrobacterales bacterium]